MNNLIKATSAFLQAGMGNCNLNFSKKVLRIWNNEESQAFTNKNYRSLTRTYLGSLIIYNF